ncbi:unnamed protein product [Rotaria sp. Silwood1]|nr:unnamed protein product [Rotaria sp. Silwood1]CAF1571830.1 unnamed protein product [Rotaria sp. Silwood1]CAF3666056.1 unnamed protein product [Rotaria sp. Silwood1]CAF3697753.1 unnamed protein product [Rotaria sp. Silwood1]
MTQHVFTDKHQSSRRSSDNLDDDRSKVLSHHLPKSSNIVDKNNSSLSGTINEPGSRIEFLERNLRYIQEQQEIVLVDLHNEISRLQQENRDLHYRLIKTYSLSSTEQKQRNIDQLSSSSSPNKSNHDKLENQIYLKQHIDKLEKQLIESEQKNKYLMNTIDELNDTLSSKIEIPNTNISNKDDIQIPIQTTNNECQHLFNMTFEKEQQYIHETQRCKLFSFIKIVKLRSVLVEILNTEHLNITSKILIRDCLTSTNMSENSISKTTTTPVDMLYFNENQQQKTIASSSTAGKTSSFRHELPVRRLNLSPPQIAGQRSSSQLRPIEKRITLPPIVSGNNSTLCRDLTDVNGFLHNSSSPKNESQNQNYIKFGETSIARRERATHELQKNRLMKSLYH